MRVIELQHKGRLLELVAGLVWHPLQGPRSACERQVRALAGSGGYDLKLLRGDAQAEARHVGLASRHDGMQAGQLSVAALIADSLLAHGHRNLLVALPLPDHPGECLFVSAVGGVILADGDCAGPEAQIRARLQGDLAFGGWDLVVCPAAWQVAGAQERAFSSFFADDTLQDIRRWQLVPVESKHQALALGVLALAVILGAIGYGIYGWQQRAASQAAAAARQAEPLAARPPEAAADTPLPAPWLALPEPLDFAVACVEALTRVGTVAGNWKLDGAACEPEQLSVRWVKASESAWVSHLRALRSNAVVAADGLSATVSLPLAGLLPQGATHAEPLQPLQAARLRNFDLASRYGMTVRQEPPAAPRPPAALPGQAAPPAPPPPWAEAPLQVAVGFDPRIAAALLQAPGLRFHRLVFSYGKDGLPQYQFTGVHYVLP